MSKSTNFFGQPVYGQLIKSPDRAKIGEMNCKKRWEKVSHKNFDCQNCGSMSELSIKDMSNCLNFG